MSEAIQVTDTGNQVHPGEEARWAAFQGQSPGAAPKDAATPAAGPKDSSRGILKFIIFLVTVVLGLLVGNVYLTYNNTKYAIEADTSSTLFNDNKCAGTKPTASAFDNFPCTQAVAQDIEQAGADVTKGYVGDIDNSATPPITVPYHKIGACPVNVHWHLGAEHRSAGQYDETGVGPEDPIAKPERRRLAGAGTPVREGFKCKLFDATNDIFTNEFDWQHCKDMKVGQTYEVHWPHSTVGACNTPYQYQTPFYDGVFCGYAATVVNGVGATTHDNVGVQSQVFTIVNDDAYYYPDLIKGMIVAGDFGSDIAYYTGSTTGTSRDNTVCSAYSPITWQVDRKCHLISASSFDKMCADMKSQVDDMSGDLYPHGARTLVDKSLAATQQP